MTRPLLLLVAFLTAVSAVSAAAPEPPPPKEYDVQLRYRIQAARNQRVPQFRTLVNYLASVGFQRDLGDVDEEENPMNDRLIGRIASDRVRELLRPNAVRSLLLYPSGWKPPENLNQPVKVRLELAAGRPLEAQRVLAEEVRQQLQGLGFREPFLYDHHGYTRLVGIIPAANLEDLFKDIRTRPDGWLAPLTPINELPLPLRTINAAIRIAEVTPEPEGVAAAKEPPAPVEVPKGQEKLALELRALVGKEEPQRLSVVLLRTPGLDEPPWQGPLLEAVPRLDIEGRAGQVVTVRATPEQALALAKLPTVVSIFLARSGAPVVPPATNAKGGNADALRNSGLTRLHGLGFEGQGVRVALIGHDFRGFEALRGKRLPADTRLLDLTRERNINFLPEPYPGKEAGPGYSTHCAVAVMQAAPEAELTLIRVDPTAINQMVMVARAINGDPVRSESLDHRREELNLERQRIAGRWDILLRQQRLLQDNPAPADELDPDAIKQQERRDEHRKEGAKLTAEEKLYRESLDRYVQFMRDLQELRRLQVFVSTLYWPDGHPVDGDSVLTRYLEDRPFRSAWWVQAAGDTRGQAWSGLFRDADGNGVMEFAPPNTPLRPERWTREINFLAWQPNAGARRLDLPAKATLRVTVQWREAHDPAFLRNSEDPYTEPLASVRLMLLRQRDPSGKRLPADELEVVARSVGTPLRLSNRPDAATYQQVMEVTVEEPGRYALRVEGAAPATTRPTTAATLPEQQTVRSEMRVRLFLDVNDAASRAAGRAVFLDYVSGEGDVAMPGDALRAVTVSAADSSNLPRQYSATGPALGRELLPKPTVLAYDGLELATRGQAIYGSGVSAAFAGGVAATLLSNGAPPVWLRSALPTQPEGLFLAPSWWNGYQPLPRR